MVDFSERARAGVQRETASLVVNALVTRWAETMRGASGDHPLLRPTVYVPTRRGETLTWEDVVASRV